MKPLLPLSCILILLGCPSLLLKAQWDLPVTFENPDEVAVWNSFANNDLPDDLHQVANPEKGGINVSDSCCMFTIDSAAGQWVGSWSNSYGYVAFTPTRHTMEVMVYSDTIHTVGVRGQNPLEPGENQYGPVGRATMTKTNEWELLTFDVSGASGITYSVLTLFADINENRTQGSVLYWDNLGWAETVSYTSSLKPLLIVYPNPASDMITVKSPLMERVVLTNLRGQQVLSIDSPASGSQIIDIRSLEPGIYILSVFSEREVVRSKIIKR